MHRNDRSAERTTPDDPSRRRPYIINFTVATHGYLTGQALPSRGRSNGARADPMSCCLSPVPRASRRPLRTAKLGHMTEPAQTNLRPCPSCGAPAEIRIAYPAASEAHGMGAPVLDSFSCPNAFDPDHRNPRDDELQALING
jgi:hypothetical protein